MSEWNLDVEYILPEMSGLPGKKRITGRADQITKIMDAVMSGKLDRITEQEKALIEATAKNNYYEKAIGRGGRSWFNLGGSARIAYCNEAREQLQSEGLI